jgi:hypothetical protein
VADGSTPIDRAPTLFGRTRGAIADRHDPRGWPWNDSHYCRCVALGGRAGNPHLHALPRQQSLFGDGAAMAAK